MSILCCGGTGFYVYLIIEILLLAFVWFKADEYGMDPVLWLVAVFFFGPIAFAIFLIIVLSQTRVRGRREDKLLSRFGGSMHGGYEPPPEPAPMSEVDLDFHDEHMEQLIENCEFGKARQYLREMVQMARDDNDESMVRNYSQYQPKLNKAAMEAAKKQKKDSDY